MRAILFLTALAVAAPAVAHAQDATERRRAQAFENLRQLETNQRIGEVERQITNMEIRRQSEATLRALQAPVIVPQTSYDVPGSSAATGVSPIRPMGARPGPGVTQSPLLTTPYPSPSSGVTPIAPLQMRVAPSLEMSGISTEDRLRDLELAASNARLREIAASQRGQ